MKKRHIWAVFSVLAAYFAMLALLVYAESFSPDASILSLKDALWYSVVTLTTVGYGDLSPVTMPGKIIGGVFLLLSTSLLAMLVVLVMTFGQLWVRFRLGFAQSKQWFVFSSLNPATCRLAIGIINENPSAVVVFPRDDDNKELAASLKKHGVFFVKGGMEDMLSLKKDTAGTNLFFMTDDGYANYRQALAFSGKGCRIYCQSAFSPRSTPADITVFSTAENCARLYWRGHPLPKTAASVAIIGSGEYMEAILQQALQVNLLDPRQSVHYHIFAESDRFIKLHPQLSQLLCINQTAPDRDSLFFHTAPWEDDIGIITAADRVIICGDTDDENLKIFDTLTKYFVVKGDVHIRLNNEMPGTYSFGGHSRLYTPAVVMRTVLTRTAAAMHQIYLDSTGAEGPAWHQLSSFTRGSNISAADHLLTKIRILLDDDTITDINSRICMSAFEKYNRTKEEKADFYRHLEHDRWMRFHALYNWTHSPQRDNSRRMHPSMVPFDRLEKSTQIKDDYSWQLLGQLADFLKE